jgi:ABC-type branched-subunit amino acid transport system substrate-binding protein
VAGIDARAQTRPANAPLRLLQCIDSAGDQQELARDYAVGVQLAVQSVKRSGLLQGRELLVQQLSMEASPQGLQQLVQRLRDEPGVLGLVGTVGERLGLACIEATQQAGLPIAHVAPWIADVRFDEVPQVLNLFASRETCLRHALNSLESVGMRGVGLVYDSPATQAGARVDLDRALERLSLRVLSVVAPEQGGVEALVTRSAAALPPVLLFVGGAIELARFARALSGLGLQRYVVSLSDADLTLLQQLGAAKTLPLVLTQVVPNPQTHQALFARDYRRLLDILYDDAPSPLGLAGFVAGRYAAELARRVLANPTRAAFFDEARRRPSVDIDGYPVRFGKDRSRGSSYVTQTMIHRDGRLSG